MTDRFEPLVPRPLDRPRPVPLDPDADLSVLDSAKIIAAPQDAADWPAWRTALTAWRTDSASRHGYRDALYHRDDLDWAARCYVVSQVWLWDELLYDADSGHFTPDRLVEDAQSRFGGFDGIVLWHAYPIIGLDDRNQWDYYRLVPGLAALVDRLHELGLKVFLDYNPWDTGTRRAGDDADELAALVSDLDADGVFLDTLKEGADRLLGLLEAARPGVAVEGESTLPLARIQDHPLSWAQWFADSETPGVVRSHWYERRHMMHHVRRWHRDHHHELQSAWLNGIGVMVWEVVFGSWVGWNDHDSLTLRRMVAAQRALHELLINGGWSPLTGLDTEAAARGLYASTFTADSQALIAIVNRSDVDTHVRVVPPALPMAEQPDNTTVLGFDIWTGLSTPIENDEATVAVPGHGIGGLWITADHVDTSWLTPLGDDSASVEFPYRSATRVTPAPSLRLPGNHDHLQLTAGPHPLTVRYRHRETGMYEQAPFVDEWKPLAPRLHDLRTLDRSAVLDHPVAVATAEVDELSFAHFVSSTQYRPRESDRYPDLPQPAWLGRGPEACDPQRAVVDVNLDDARAYAAWMGARLPTEDEWQLAAALPKWRRHEPLVWNLTESEHRDGRTRYLMLKGGSAYAAPDSPWYIDGGPQDPDFAVKYLVPGLGLDRSPTVGFRLAWDLSKEPKQ